jgi:cathepsin E
VPYHDNAGTTLLLIASDAYNRYVSATGAVFDNATGLLRITSAQLANLKSLFFHINGVNIPVSFVSRCALMMYGLHNFR